MGDQGMSVIGWKLDREQRAELLEQFPPEWPDDPLPEGFRIGFPPRPAPDPAAWG